MPILPEDIRLFAAERKTDFDDGGGRMSSTVIVDGADNNLFDDVTDFDRNSGRVSLRKFFGQVLSEDQDPLLSAYVFVDSRPTDPATDACIFKTGGLTTERAAALAAFKAYAPGTTVDWGNPPTFTATAGSAAAPNVISADAVVGATLLITTAATGLGGTEQPSGAYCMRRVTARTDIGGGAADLTLDAALPFSGTAYVFVYASTNSPNQDGLVRAYGVCAFTAALADEAVSGALVDPFVQVAAQADGTAPGASAEGFGSLENPTNSAHSSYRKFGGFVQIFRPGDVCLVHQTSSTAPAAASNGGSVDVGRTDLARLEVVGSDGTVHARFDRNAPAPTGVGCSADLAMGVVSFSDVSGFAQPVTIRHRIEELLGLTGAGSTGLVTFNRPLSRAYPSGVKLSNLLRLGDLQGRIEGGFSQSAWTGVWSDTRIGGEPLADYNDVAYPILANNKGAVEERWAVLFTNTTTFRVIGEFSGEVGNGNVGVDFSPINPATGEPFFTLQTEAWGLGWAAGNVWRFNTKGANAPGWGLRSVAASVPGGDDKVVIEFRGFVNA